MFEPQSFLEKKEGKTILSRDRVQSMALLEHTFDFHRGFTVVFESSTKPQREAQNDLSEHRVLIFTRLLQWFSEARTQQVAENKLSEVRAWGGGRTRHKPWKT